MDFKKLRKVLAIGFVVCLVLCAGAIGLIRRSIQNSLDQWCVKAQEAHPHPGDNVAAMIEYIQSDSHSLHDRNLAVWALGQARDSRALPALEGYYYGAKCEHNSHLCQMELSKAIKLCNGETPNLLRIKTP